MTGYRSHVLRDVPALASESARRQCACGMLRRVRSTATGYVTEDSSDGETWTATTFGAACPRRR